MPPATPPLHIGDPPASAPAASGAKRIVAAVLGMGLLAAAIIVLAGQFDTVQAAWSHMAQTPPARRAALLAALALSVVGNIALTGLMFQRLTSRYGRVGAIEMQALIASATLINYLPLRPGVIGRVAYHKSVHGIAVGDSLRVVVQAAILSGLAAMTLAMIALLNRSFETPSLVMSLAPLAALPFAAIMSPSDVRPVVQAFSLRYADVLVTAARYGAAFALIGSDISWSVAVAFACISVLATMVPLVSNGLGLREWAVALLAPVIAAQQMQLGLTADLLNRAAEMLMVLAAGVPATVWLMRRVRATKINPA